MQGSAIRASELSVVRGGKIVLSRLTFSVEPGRLTGLIGPSGSGKTTLIRAIVGAQKTTGGTLKVLDKNAGSKQLRSNIGYVSQHLSVYSDLTVKQNLRYFARVLHKTGADVDRVIKQVDLGPQTRQIVESLSGGQQARVSLAVALLSDAQVLILDEPTVGLDPLLRKQLWRLFRKLAEQGRTLVISSHVMDEAEKCDDIMLLRGGRILIFDTKAAILEQTHTRSVEDAFLKLVEGSADQASSHVLDTEDRPLGTINAGRRPSKSVDIAPQKEKS